MFFFQQFQHFSRSSNKGPCYTTLFLPQHISVFEAPYQPLGINRHVFFLKYFFLTSIQFFLVVSELPVDGNISSLDNGGHKVRVIPEARLIDGMVKAQISGCHLYVEQLRFGGQVIEWGEGSDAHRVHSNW